MLLVGQNTGTVLHGQRQAQTTLCYREHDNRGKMSELINATLGRIVGDAQRQRRTFHPAGLTLWLDIDFTAVGHLQRENIGESGQNTNSSVINELTCWKSISNCRQHLSLFFTFAHYESFPSY